MYGADEVHNVYTIAEIHQGGYTATEVHAANYTSAELHTVYGADEVHNVYTIGQFIRAVTIRYRSLGAANYTAELKITCTEQMKYTTFTASQKYNYGGYTATEVHAAHYTATELQ